VTADERRFEVLRAIVADYVETTEPVGSKALVERHQLNVSAATIRNDMAALEEDGYITQPHTSAGRIPTDKGYRLFVDRLARVRALSAAERQAIRRFLAESVDLDDALRRSVRLLAQLTHQVAVVQYPTMQRAVVRHIEIVPLAVNRLLVVVITDSGRVEQRVVDLVEDVTEESVALLRIRLAERVTGRRVQEAAAVVEQLPNQVSHRSAPLFAAVSAVLTRVLVEHPDERLLLSGTSNLTDAWVDQPNTLRGVLEALDEQVTVLKLLALAIPDSVTVRIGVENADANLAASALVSAGYAAGDRVLGGLAVVGPTRMDYPGTMAAVRAVAQYVGELIGER
jgi:heat-inducible transcriptional repressor